MTAAALDRYPYILAAAVCVGLAAANAARTGPSSLAVSVIAVVVALVLASARARVAALAVGLVLTAWWWGSARLDVLDRSALSAHVGTAARALVVVTAPPRHGRFDVRVQAVLLRYGRRIVHEPVLLKLPAGRAPPLGGRLEALGVLTEPRGPSRGFDEKTWLRRRGIHVVFRVDRWRVVGRRGGAAAVGDRLHSWLGRSIARGLHGERAGVVAGVVLGEDELLSEQLRLQFRASGLYHLLAVSGQNVALVAGGVLGTAWVVGVPRWIGELGALAGIVAYVLAVGAQPSVVRAGIAAGLASLAWLTARLRDRWHVLLVAAAALLAWNPYALLDPGFELSFAAVTAIFTLVPPIMRRLEGYPVPRSLAGVVAISTACGLATAPVSWFQFHAVSLLTVPANALAAPAVVPVLTLGLATALLAPVSPATATALAWVNGWCAAYLAACARLISALPGAQIRSDRAGAAIVSLLAGGTAAYAWRRWRRS